MKKEMLRVNDLNYRYALARKLENISLCILEGECVGFLGLTYSGKDLLIQILTGEVEISIDKYSIYAGGEKISTEELLRKNIYHMCASNYNIDNWTVAEYIGLVDSGWLKNLASARRLEMDVAESFIELDIEIDVSKKLSALTELEKRVIDLVKAYRKGAKIIVIEDEFEGIAQEEIERFGWVMKRVIVGRMGVIISSHSNMIMYTLSDKYVIFNKGQIVKKCLKSHVRDRAHLEEYLLGDMRLAKRQLTREAKTEPPVGENVIYEVTHLGLMNGRTEAFRFRRGEVVTFLVPDIREKERIFMELSGREIDEHARYRMGDHLYTGAEYQMFVENKIVSIKNLGSDEEIFPGLSVGENLLLPSLGKISAGEYIFTSRKMLKMLTEDIDSEEMFHDMLAEHLEVNDLIQMTLERWYIYNPKVIVLFEPFALCDVFGVEIVKKYTKKFANHGTTVIIVNTREEYAEDISDRVIDTR